MAWKAGKRMHAEAPVGVPGSHVARAAPAHAGADGARLEEDDR